MRAVVQRCREGSVSVDGQQVARVGPGMVVLVGVSKDDGAEDAEWLAEKVANLRIFEGPDGKMNLSALDVGGAALVVSQFTLYGDCRKGRRPGFDRAAAPDKAEELYQVFANGLDERGVSVQTGRFRTKMLVEIVNDGPVTLLLDSRQEL